MCFHMFLYVEEGKFAQPLGRVLAIYSSLVTYNTPTLRMIAIESDTLSVCTAT